MLAFGGRFAILPCCQEVKGKGSMGDDNRETVDDNLQGKASQPRRELFGSGWNLNTYLKYMPS
jgi:hypothetical protein